MKSFLLLFFMIPTLSFAQVKRAKLEFALSFGACFKQDSIGVKVQNVSVFSGRIRSSIVSKANLSILQRGRFLEAFHDGITKRYKKVKTTPLLTLEFVVNSKYYRYTFDLKNGAFFLIQNCNTREHKADFTIQQSKGAFVFF